MVNPRRVRDFAKAMSKLAKTDALDAYVLAYFGSVMTPEATVFGSEAEQELKAWVTRRSQLVEMMASEKNRRTQLKGTLKDNVQAHIDWLKEQIEQLDEDIKRLSDTKVEWRQQKAILQSTKGIGPVVSIGLLTYLPELGDSTAKKSRPWRVLHLLTAIVGAIAASAKFGVVVRLSEPCFIWQHLWLFVIILPYGFTIST